MSGIDVVPRVFPANPILSWKVLSNRVVVFRSKSVVECYDFIKAYDLPGKPIADYKVDI